MNCKETKPFKLSLSAPGKIILFGEYSVVFNRPALAATLCLRTKLNLSETSDGFLRLKFAALDVNESFSLADIGRAFKKIRPQDWQEYLTSLKNGLVDLCRERREIKSNLTDDQINSLMAFFHSFGNCLPSSPGFVLDVDSELAIGSGVGSSASFSVVLAAAAFLYERHIRKDENVDDVIERNGTSLSIINEKWVNLISETAYSNEKIFHGSPSGVDNNTVLRGSMLEFVKSDDGNNEMRSIIAHPIKILLVNTNVQRSTKALVGNVRQLLKNHSDIIECVLNAMENVARRAVKILEGPREPRERNGMEDQFGELITLNHNLLRVLGVSHPALEHIISIANKHGLNGKLTGAGGGGFAFIYLPGWVKASVVADVKMELSDAGYTATEVSLGGPGLTIEELVF